MTSHLNCPKSWDVPEFTTTLHLLSGKSPSCPTASHVCWALTQGSAHVRSLLQPQDRNRAWPRLGTR